MENRRVFKAINTNPNSWLFCRGSSGQENRITAYNELRKVIIYYLNKKEIDFNEDEIEEAIRYRKCRIHQLSAPPEREESLSYILPEYFEKIFSDFPESLNLQPQNI